MFKERAGRGSSLWKKFHNERDSMMRRPDQKKLFCGNAPALRAVSTEDSKTRKPK